MTHNDIQQSYLEKRIAYTLNKANYLKLRKKVDEIEAESLAQRKVDFYVICTVSFLAIFTISLYLILHL